MHLTSQCIREEIAKEISDLENANGDPSPTGDMLTGGVDETVALTPNNKRRSSRPNSCSPEARIADAIEAVDCTARIPEPVVEPIEAVPRESGLPPTPRAAAQEAVSHDWPAWNYHTADFSEIRKAFGIGSREYLDAFPTSEEVRAEANPNPDHSSMTIRL